MPAVNVVRFKVKTGREKEFLDAHRGFGDGIPGLRRGVMIKTGDRSYCLVGIWANTQALVAARPAMIANLDKIRDSLEDLGGGLGVTDAVSGEAVMELGTPRGGRRGGAREEAAGGGGGGGEKDPDKARRAEAARMRDLRMEVRKRKEQRAGKKGQKTA